MKNPALKGYHCFIYNKTKHKITVHDLGITLQPQSTMDVLNWEWSTLTPERVQASYDSGDLSRIKKAIIFKQSVPSPQLSKARTVDISKVAFPYKYRVGTRVEEKKFAELDIENNAEEFAEQNVEAATNEHSPRIDINESSSANNEQYDEKDE